MTVSKPSLGGYFQLPVSAGPSQYFFSNDFGDSSPVRFQFFRSGPTGRRHFFGSHFGPRRESPWNSPAHGWCADALTGGAGAVEAAALAVGAAAMVPATPSAARTVRVRVM
ncbi:hypothetical protein SALBM135S_04513 [Streptomyces alboniger]